MSDILRLREQLNSTWPREEIDLDAVARLIGGLDDRTLVAADVLRDDVTALRNAEREGAALGPGYSGLLADRLDDVLQHLAAEKRGHEHYMTEWSEVCNENQGLLNLLSEACDMLSLIGCSPEGIGRDVAEAEALQARILVALGPNVRVAAGPTAQGEA